MKGIFKIVRTHANGQVDSLYVISHKCKTVRGLMQHERQKLINIMGFDKGDSITAELLINKFKNLDGFQVVDKDNEIHPSMDASFCLYRLFDAMQMVKDDPNKWTLLPIYKGDVEEPTYMFVDGELLL